MGWRSTLVLVALVITVAAYLWFEDSGPKEPDRMSAQPSGMATARALPKLVAFEPGTVVSIHLRRADVTRTIQRQNGSWQDHDNSAAIDDFLKTLSNLPILMDISSAQRNLADFGLAPPSGIIVLDTAENQTVVLQIGNHNPATTGVYVRSGQNGAVVLVGALVEWEFDNLFKNLSPGN